MRVVITGASGNVGTSLVAALLGDPAVDSIVGVARRRPEGPLPEVEWRGADVAADDLEPIFAGADAVVHLAWLIQPSRDSELLRRVNVNGSERVFEAAARADVPTVIHASSVGTYSRGSKGQAVDESWPAAGIATSFYSRHKAEVERYLDGFEARHPGIRVVRLRPGLTFKAEAATGIRRLFIGPFLPKVVLGRRLVPIIPRLPGLRLQAVHSDDVAEAYRLAVLGDARGAFNVAADPPLGPRELGRVLGARPLRLPVSLVRGAADLTWRLHLQPSPPGWLDLGLGVPLMDTTRVRRELGWVPKRGADEALAELLTGIGAGDGFRTPPLDPGTSGPSRARELLTGVGSRGGV